MRQTLLFLVALAGGCERGGDRAPAPAAAAASVTIECGTKLEVVAVTVDRSLGELCGAPWSSLRLEARGRTELLKSLPDREVWLRPSATGALVEVRRRGAVTARHGGVTRIAALTAAAVTPEPSISIAHGSESSTLTERDLRERAARGGGGREVSLCRLAGDFRRDYERISVSGELPQPLTFTRAECEERRLVLKLSGRGEIRLRSLAGDHFLRQVTSVSL